MDLRVSDRIGVSIDTGRSFDLMTGTPSAIRLIPAAAFRNWQIGVGRLVGITVLWLGRYASINLHIVGTDGGDS